MLLITFLQNEFINTTVLPDKKKGHYKLNHGISSLTEDINIDGIDNKWIISGGTEYSIYRYSDDDNAELVQQAELTSDDVLTIDIAGTRCILIVETIKDEKNRFNKICFNNPSSQKFSIGKKSDNDIVLDDTYISGYHALISKENGVWKVTDRQSRNGTYVNNRRIDGEHELNIGDVVFIVGYKFIICADFIAANIDFDKNVKGSGLSKVVFPKFVRPVKKSESHDDYFYRTVDLGEKAPELPEIKLLPPEHMHKLDEQPAILSMGPAMTMSTATVLVSAYSGLAAYYRGTNISYVVPSFIMAGSMVLSSMMWPNLLRKRRKKVQKKNEAQRIKEYQDYIMDLRAAVNVMLDNEKEYLCKKSLTAEQCLTRVINHDRFLWSKSINDEDFLSAAIGTGKKESQITVKYTEDADTFFKDDLRYDMMQFAHDERILYDVPITISLNKGCICGISGEKTAAYDLIKEIVVQLTSLYSYDELKLIFICGEDEAEKWDYVKWLPHTWNSENSFRYFSSSADELKELAAELEKEIDNRMTHPQNDFPKMLVIASNKKYMDSLDIMSVIMKNRESLNISILTAFGMYNYNNSNIIIEISAEGAKVYDRKNSDVSEFKPYTVPTAFDSPVINFENYLDSISNIKLDITNEKYQLPKMITFLDMFKVSKVEHLNSLTRWAENNPIKSLKTEIGASPSGDVFFIDMHEKYHGPHGLIAGTTGSGKSESIITVILSLAVNYSPEEVAFVIVDYKGGGLADAFNDVKEEVIDGKTVEVSYKLPHVVGTVTNLDGSTIERACISIETEIKRRQILFKKARKISNEGTMDIYKYQQLRREGADLEVLPHLFIVCDEFAELKADRSDFMDLLVSAARIGRSLGVHLILATQKPDSVVSPQIWSNSRFKICLKVQGKDDSKAVIQCPDAAEISTTGRFFFQVGYNEVFSMGQSAWCGADYIEAEDFVKSDIESAEVIGNTGNIIYEKVRKPEIKVNKNKRTVSQLIAVRNYLIDIAKDIDVRPLWLDPIPAKLSLKALYSELGERKYRDNYVPLDPIIGKRDDLYNRIQEIMTVPFSEKGNLIIYGAAGSGLDMFFISFVYSLIYAYNAEQVNIYILDFDAGFLKVYDKAPQVGDVVLAEEEEDVKNIISSISEEINRRSKLFSEYRGEYSEYCKYSGSTLPNIVLILNNYTAFMEKFNEAITSQLIFIAREGVKRGIYVVIGTPSINTNFRLRQYIQQTFMLKMNDVNDYVGILGRTGGITPSDCAGSGIVKESDITYKFQTADIFDIIPSDDESDEVILDSAKEIRDLCENINKNWNGRSAQSYKQIEVNAENVLSESISWKNVPLGTVDENVFTYDMSDKYITFVSSVSENKLTRFAGYITKALAKDDSISVVLLDSSGELRPDEDVNYKYYSTVEEFNEWNKFYKADAEERCSKLIRNEQGEIVMSEDAKHVYVVINSFQKASKIADLNVTFNNFKLIINELPEVHYHYVILDTENDMNADRGAYVHIVKNLEDITSLENFDTENNREWFDASGIWLGGSLSKNGLFTIENSLPMLTESEAVVIRNKNVEKKFRYFG